MNDVYIERGEKDLDEWDVSLNRLNRGITLVLSITSLFWIVIALIYKEMLIVFPAMITFGFISRYYVWKVEQIEENYNIIRALEEL